MKNYIIYTLSCLELVLAIFSTDLKKSLLNSVIQNRLHFPSINQQADKIVVIWKLRTKAEPNVQDESLRNWNIQLVDFKTKSASAEHIITMLQ